MRIRVASMLLVASLAYSGADAQKPPPPRVVAPGDARPRIMHNRLDMSLCHYPVRAQRDALEGCCRMKVVIGVDGKAGPMTGECTDDIFYEPSKSCLSPQAYIPARRAGRAIKETGDIVVEYRLTEAETPPVIALLERAFPALKRPKPPPPQDDICNKRPDDLISALDRLRGG